MNAKRHTPIDVLLIEPDAEHAGMLEAALSDCGAAVTSVRSREQASHVLHNSRPPELIILAFDLPEQGSPDLLVSIKRDERLCHIPVLVLTASADPATIDQAWDFRANCVVNKPATHEELERILRTLSSFWLNLVLLPRSRSAQAARG